MLKRIIQVGILGFLAMAAGFAYGQAVYDHSCNNGGGSSTSTLSCTISSVTAGALLMIGDSDSTSNTRTVTVDGTAATLITTQIWAGAGLSGNIYYFANAAAGTHTVTVTYSAPVGYPTMIVNAFNNAPTSGTIIDVSNSLASTPASTINCGNLVTTGVNEVQWAFGVVAGGITVSSGTGYSGINGFSSNVQSETAAAATAGTYSPFFTGAASNQSVCLTAAINPAVPAAGNPTFSPATGTYGPAQTVTLATATSGATIVYTTDGSTPTATGGTATHGTTYTTPFSVSVTSTVKAIASKSGIVNSPVGSATYTIVGMRTWYVRTDGGTPYSATNTAGRCSGLVNAADTGSGTNQPCAVSNLQDLWADGVSLSKTWIIAGGDLVSIAAGSYREGWKTVSGTTTPNCNGDAIHCFNPSIPVGTAGQPTTFQGAGSAVTELHGGWGSETVLDLRGSTNYVAFNGIGITDFSACGLSSQAHGCLGPNIPITAWSIASNVATFTTNTTVPITAWSITTNVVTMTAANTFAPGQRIALSGFATSTFFNGQSLNVRSATGTQFTASFFRADSSATEAATGTNVNPYVPGQQITLSGFGTSTFFNGQAALVVSATPTQFALNFTHVNGSATEVGGVLITEDFAKYGMELNNASCNLTLTDINIHGMSSTGMLGSACNVTMNTVKLIGNASSGWNGDDGGSGVNSFLGPLTMTNLTIIGTGCAEQYPIVYPAANSLGDCTSDQGGGYGDGFGTADSNNAGSSISCDQCVFAYNTQEGFDGLHFYRPISMTRSLAYGNQGNQVKLGGPAIIRNNYFIGSCYAMMQPAFGPFTATYNSAPQDPCRANGATLVVRADDSFGAQQIQGNTLFVANGNGGAIGLEIDPLTACSTATCAINYRDNVQIGFTNDAAHGHTGGDGFLSTPIVLVSLPSTLFTNTGGANDHNANFWPGNTGTCPNTGQSETNALCTTPGLTDQTWHITGYGVATPASGGSSVVGSGVALSGLTLDFAGLTRPNPPSRGAYEFSNAVYMYHAPPMSPMR